MISAVIDRFEEDKVVLLVGEDEQKVVFPKNLLDENLKEGDYLSIDIKYDEVATKKAILNSSFEKILLLHSDKFGKVNSSYFADLNEFDTIITDANLSDEWKNRIDSLKIKLILV